MSQVAAKQKRIYIVRIEDDRHDLPTVKMQHYVEAGGSMDALRRALKIAGLLHSSVKCLEKIQNDPPSWVWYDDGFETSYEVVEVKLKPDIGARWLAVAEKQHRHLDYMALMVHRAHSNDGTDYDGCTQADCRYSVSLRAEWQALKGE